MNQLGHRLAIACLAILSALALARSSGAEQLVAPPANGLVRASPSPKPARVVYSPENLVLQGISTLGNRPVALLSVKYPDPPYRPTALDVGLSNGNWFAAGDSAFGGTVKTIANDHVILAAHDTVAEIKISLDSASATASEPKPYSRAWINSRANPMLLYAQYIPSRMLSGAWDVLPGKEKTQILEFYRNHGWQLIPSKTGLGPSEFEWRNLYETERARAIEANREKFARTLTPEQLGLWQQMRGFKAVYIGPNVSSKELHEIQSARQPIYDDFLKSLTPEQKAEYESIQDFTKASWK